MPFDPSSYGRPRFDPDSDIEVINDGGPFGATVAARGKRTRGKQRYTIEIESQPLLHHFDEHMLGAEPAQAIKEALIEAIKGITAQASAATIRRREQAARALERGARWATKRYSGGRTGTKPPNQSDRLFNDSGRFAEGLHVQQNKTDRTFTVNVPVNRLNREQFGRGFDAMIQKLRDLVPALADMRKLLDDPRVSEAIDRSIDNLITKADSNSRHKLEALAKARKQALLAIARGVVSVTTKR